MRKVTLRLPSPALLVALLALFASLGGTGYALISSSNIPDSHGIFHACVNKATGAVRIVAGASQCRRPSGRGRNRKPGELATFWQQSTNINGIAAGGDLSGTYPSPRIAAGSVTASKIGAIPAAAVTNSADIVIPGDGSHNVLSFDTDQVNTGGVHSTTINPSRLTAPIDGIYAVHGQANWFSCNGTSFEELEIYVNNFATRVGVTAIPPSATSCVAESVNALVRLHAGDYVILSARQVSGATAMIRGTSSEMAPDSPEFDMYWVGP